MQKKILLLLFACTFCLLNYANAQVKQITGNVTDAETNLPLPGANVSVKGTTIGTATDADGNYSLSIGSNDPVLVFSFIGYEALEITISGQSIVNASLQLESAQLDDVIVVAYGVTRKEAATGSVSVLKSEELETSLVSSAEKALQGKIAGVQINNYSGQPGGGTDIYIRGISSINSGNSPLYVIDGVPVISGEYGYSTKDNNVMSTMNPSDIESITVLKDAASASVYGSRAANGVILITTKSGSKGDTKFQLNTRYGISRLAESGDYRFMNPDELLQYHRDAVTNAGFDPDDTNGGEYYYPMSLLDGPQTDWFDKVFRTGKTTNIDLSASGGNEKTNFFMSGAYYNEEGIMIGSDLERFNLTLNVDHKANEKVSLGAKVRGSYSKISDLPQDLYWSSPIYGAQNMLPWETPYSTDGSYNWDVPSNFGFNPLGVVDTKDQWDKFYRMSTNLYLEWEIIKDLKFKTTNSVDYLNSEGRSYNSPLMPDGKDTNGSLWTGLTTNYNLLSSNTLNYVKELSKLGRIRLLIGQEIQYNNYEQYGLEAQGVGFVTPYVSQTTKDKQQIKYDPGEWSLSSYFGIFDYNYNDKYLVTASLRRDGSSRFATNKKWGTFYSAGLSWNIHNENFMDNIDYINYLKFRVNYGTSGNFNIGNYEHFELYGNSEYNSSISTYPDRLGDDNLRWEQNKEVNIGLDFNLFGKVDITTDYYNRITSDMLLDVNLPYTTGTRTQVQNVGELKNSGVELGVNANLYKNTNSNLDFNFNISYNKTEILDLGGEEQMLDGWNRIHKLNENFSQWYVYDWAGVNPTTGMGMWYDEDGNLTESFSNARRISKGQLEPNFVGGFSLTYSWKGFSITPLFEFKTGHYVYIMESTYTKSDGWYIGHNQVASQLDYWKQPGDIVEVPKPIYGNSSNSNAWRSSRWIEKGDYLRFKQLNLNYRLPETWANAAKLNTVDVYFEASNLYVWHNVSYWDPERGYDGNTYSTYPMARKFMFGIKLGF